MSSERCPIAALTTAVPAIHVPDVPCLTCRRHQQELARTLDRLAVPKPLELP